MSSCTPGGFPCDDNIQLILVLLFFFAISHYVLLIQNELNKFPISVRKHRAVSSGRYWYLAADEVCGQIEAWLQVITNSTCKVCSKI